MDFDTVTESGEMGSHIMNDSQRSPLLTLRWSGKECSKERVRY